MTKQLTSSTKYPSFDAYQAALQFPQHAFLISDLKKGELELDLWGFPRVRSGGFALTYRLQNPHGSFAIRCFHKDISDRAYRYRAISLKIASLQNSSLVPIQYFPRGVSVGGGFHPITSMPWVEGETLELWLYQNHNKPLEVHSLAAEFLRVMRTLVHSGIAHGDLSHQNIMVSNKKVILVDYDGMFVPDLRGKSSCEVGHSNFQHPRRDMTMFSPELDHFSSIVIYLALEAIAYHPDLWTKYESEGDGLMFRKADFLDPYSSQLLQEIETISSLRKHVYLFRKICLTAPENIPNLEVFLNGSPINLPRDEEYFHQDYSSKRTVSLDATKRFPMVNQLGKVVSVVGKVSDIFEGRTRDGKPHIYINFGNWKAKSFTTVIWADAYDHFKSSFGDGIDDLIGEWISVHGILTSYQRRLQIVLDSPVGLEILKDVELAKYRLGLSTVAPKQPLFNVDLDTAPSYRPVLKRYEESIQTSWGLEFYPNTILDENLVFLSGKISEEGKKRLEEFERTLQEKIDYLYADDLNAHP